METAIKLLQNKFRSSKIFETLNERTKTSDSLCIVETSINKIKFRILVLKECCLTKDLCVLYDSLLNNDSNKKQNSDWKNLTELIFGTAVTNRKSSTILKVHELRDSNQLLISNVFTTKAPRTKFNSENSLAESEQENFFLQNRNTSRRKACTLPNSTQFYCNPINYSDSLFGNPKCFHSSLKSHQMINKNNNIQCSTDLRTSSKKEMTRKKCTVKRRNKYLAFGLLCQLESSNTNSFIKFFYENFPLFENHLNCLKSKVEAAVVYNGSSKPFVNTQMIKQALNDVADKFNILYATPRLPDIMWSKINIPNLPQDDLNEAENTIISQISQLIVNPENKTVNKNRLNFTCSLITSVMTNHLGWVSSVAHSDTEEVVDVNFDDIQMYNPLLAQLRDLYGAVDYPSKICKTVISGLNKETVLLILTIVSYFIRCARIKETVKVPDILTPEFFERSSKNNFDNTTDSLDLTLVPSEIEPESEYVLVSFNEPTISNTKNICESDINNRSRSNAFIEFKCGSYGTIQSSSDEGSDFQADNEIQASCHQATTSKTRITNEYFRDDQCNSLQSFNFTEEESETNSYDQSSTSYSTAENEDKPKIKVSPTDDDGQAYFNNTMVYQSGDDKTKFSLSGDDFASVTSHATSGNDFMFKEISMDDIMVMEGEISDDDDISSTFTGYSSLMTGYNASFSNDFVLQGVAKPGEQTKFDIMKDLKNFNGSSVLDDVVVESRCILADSDTWTVKMFSSKRVDDEIPCINSKMVQNLILQIASMHSMNIQSSFCLEHLERGLQIISMKAQTLSSYLKCNKKSTTTMQLSSELDIDGTDLPLLMAVSKSYQPCYDLL